MKSDEPLSDEVREVAKRIGEYYLFKCNNDYEEAERQLRKLEITELEVDKDTVSIKCCYVGMLIGKRGENIDKLETFLNRKIRIYEERDPLYSWLIPLKPEEDVDEQMWDEYDNLDCELYGDESWS